MSILSQRLTALILVTGVWSSFAFTAQAESEPAKTPAERPPVEKAPTEKPPTTKERLTKQSLESYQRLKELRETLAHLDMALANSDSDKAWEHSAQLKILWETLSPKQRISMERRYPGTKVRVEKAIADGKALARGPAPKDPVARAKDQDKSAGDGGVVLAKKAEETKPEAKPIKEKE